MKSPFVYQYVPAACLKVTDEDSADFLQSQFSNDLRPFRAGQCTYGLWLDNKGKVCADSYVLCSGEEEFYVLSKYSSASLIQEKLESHIIADEVVLEALPLFGGALFGGVEPSEIYKLLGVASVELGCFGEANGLLYFSSLWADVGIVEVFCLSGQAQARIDDIVSIQKVSEVSENWIHRLRVGSGVPLVPAEVGPSDLPGEGALVPAAASLTKGCYLGQEVVARMYNVGRPQRALYQLKSSGATPNMPAPIMTEVGKVVGELRTVYAEKGSWSGVGMVKKRFIESGETLYLEDEIAIESITDFAADQRLD
ncbi:MAG: hypothetical protein AAGC73_01830 [Verrucomicrobiota bacterium]